MNTNEVMEQLAALGTEQNRKVYRRHGVGENQYGVSFAHLKSLQKKLKIDQPLAEALWQTGNHDARVLATMIADPAQLAEATADTWGQDLDNYTLADTFSSLMSRSPLARQKMEQWINTDSEWLGQTGWDLLTHLALKDTSLPDEFFKPYLATITQEIHRRKNRVRYAMNNTLIAIGLRNSTLQAEAIAAATKIGKVEVDHGQTNCKTPDAISYIHKAAARKQK